MGRIFGKPLETMGQQSYGAKAGEIPLRSPGCILANRGKPRDRKVMGAKVRNPKLYAPCQPGRRTLFASENSAKKGRLK